MGLNSENFLLRTIQFFNISVRRFPSPAYLSCCPETQSCFMSRCESRFRPWISASSAARAVLGRVQLSQHVLEIIKASSSEEAKRSLGIVPSRDDMPDEFNQSQFTAENLVANAPLMQLKGKYHMEVAPIARSEPVCILLGGT